MSERNLIPWLITAFGIGCVAGPALADLVVPASRAEQGDRQRWDDSCVQVWGAAEVTTTAQSLGRDGWEMAGANATPSRAIWCFKRPL